MGTVFEDEDEDFYKDEELNSEAEVENEDVKTDYTEEYEDESALAETLTLDIGDLELTVEEDESDDEDNSGVLAPEERLRIFSDRLLSSCIGNKEIKGYALDRLFSVASPQLFRDENYVLFSVLFAYRSKIKRINIDSEFLKLFLNRNRGMLQKSKGYIDINAYGEVDGSVELGYIGGVIKHFNRLSNMEETSIEDFETCFEKYLIEFKNIEASKVYNTASVILTEGMHIGRKYYHGFDDSTSYSKRKLAEIEGLVDPNKGTGFVSMTEVLREEKERNKKPTKIGDFDRLTALNDIYGGIYTGTFYQVLAPSKGGKTKFCSRVCHTITVKYGNNVTVWAAEGGYEAWTAQMRAIHFDYTYNTGKSVTDRKYGVDQKVILEDTFATPELKELEDSSKRDLESNPSYGSVDFIDRPFEVETFLEDIDTSVRKNGSKFVIIDYLQIIGSRRNISERERIAEAYRTLLNYCKTNNIGVLSPGQYKQEVIDALANKDDTSDADMRTAGGGSSEVFRTPDIIITLWASPQDLANGEMKILSTPARMSKVFPEIPVHHDLSVCQFVSYEK